jgi:Mrp family chromosome partitioning ATPase/capsular polysaccharide biosynthesis protein
VTPARGSDPRDDAVLALRRQWPLVLAITAVCVIAANAYSSSQPPSYEAEADVLVTPIAMQGSSLLGTGLLPESNTQGGSVYTAARFFSAPQVADGVRMRLRPVMTRERLLRSVEIRPLSQTSIVTVKATAKTAPRAAAIANAFAEETIRLRTAQFQVELREIVTRLQRRMSVVGPAASTESDALRRRLATLTPLLDAGDPTLEITRRALPPDSASSPSGLVTGVAALFIGAVLGALAGLWRDFAGRGVVRSEDELSPLPVVVRIPRLDPQVIDLFQSGRASALPLEVWESYRMLRTRLALARAEPSGRARVVAVTSARRGDGRTSTAVGLATVAASAGLRTTIVDADLAHPMVASAAGVGAAGVRLLQAGLPSEDGVLTAPSGLGVLAPEWSPRLEEDLQEVDRFEDLLDRLGEHADLIVIDAPPLLESAHALVVAEAVDTVLIAVRIGHTSRDAFDQMVRFLGEYKLATARAVVIGAEPWARAEGFGDPSTNGATRAGRERLPARGAKRSTAT